MDALLARIGSQAMNCIIRQGIFLTSGFAVQQCRRLMAAVDDRALYKELKALQKLLDCKTKVRSHHALEFLLMALRRNY